MGDLGSSRPIRIHPPNLTAGDVVQARSVGGPARALSLGQAFRRSSRKRDSPHTPHRAVSRYIRRGNSKCDGFAVRRNLRIGNPLDLQERVRVEWELLCEEKGRSQSEGQPRQVAHTPDYLAVLQSNKEKGCTRTVTITPVRAARRCCGHSQPRAPSYYSSSSPAS